LAQDEPKQLPSDEELAAMLSRAEGKGGRKPRRDPKLPTPRFPEALYYYLFILIEAAILMGVWGFMRMGIEETLKGPDLEAPVMEQLTFHIKSIGVGLLNLLISQPWIPLGVLVMALPVFMPTTPAARKRMATLVSTVMVVIFVMLIALQFSDDIASAGGTGPF